MNPEHLQIFKEIQTEWQSLRSNSLIYPRNLFHYTTGYGLEGIIKSKVLWASAARYSNDLSEVLYARNLALPILENNKNLFNGKKRELYDLLKLSFANPDWPENEAFMISFCETDDLLSQWRGYGPGNGYAIGFNLIEETVVQMTTSQRLRLLLRPVDYDSGSQKDSLTEILKQSALLLSRMLSTHDVDSIIPMVRANVIFSLAEWMYTVKHPTFSQEQEWKLLGFPLKAVNKFPPFLEFGDAYDSYMGINTRVVGNRMVPYMEFIPKKGRPLPIVSVTCGPHIHQRLNARAIELLLVSNGFRDVQINLSQIPLG